MSKRLLFAMALATALTGCTVDLSNDNENNQGTTSADSTDELKAIGEACSDHAECASSYCVDWVCSATPPAESIITWEDK